MKLFVGEIFDISFVSNFVIVFVVVCNVMY